MSSRQDQLPDPHSRSQRKVDLEELRQLGAKLMELSPGKFAKLELPDSLYRAVVEGRRLTDLNARRRQLQYIQSEIDACDATIIRRDLDRIDWMRAPAAPPAPPSPDEILASQLADEGDPAVFALSSRFSPPELQTLRQAVRRARKDIDVGKARDASVASIATVIARLTSLS